MLPCVTYENMKWYNSSLAHVNIHISLCVGFLCIETEPNRKSLFLFIQIIWTVIAGDPWGPESL